MTLSDVETIDCHAHVGHFDGYDLSERTLLSELDRGDVSLALVSNIDGANVPGKTPGLDEERTNRITLDLVRRHPDRIRGLLWARPESGSAEGLESFVSERVVRSGKARWTPRAFVGMKLHPEMNGFQADDPRVDPYLELARRHRLPVVVHCDGSRDEASAERIFALARRHPGVPVVLYHMGFGGPHRPAIEVVSAGHRRGDAELYLETAQAPVEAVLEALDTVGAERVLYGTDATYHGVGHYQRYCALRAALAGTLAPDDLTRVMGGNARRLFRLSGDQGN